MGPAGQPSQPHVCVASVMSLMIRRHDSDNEPSLLQEPGISYDQVQARTFAADRFGRARWHT